jgi:hypothetical protein
LLLALGRLVVLRVELRLRGRAVAAGLGRLVLHGLRAAMVVWLELLGAGELAAKTGEQGREGEGLGEAGHGIFLLC